MTSSAPGGRGKLTDLLVASSDPLARPDLLADPSKIWLVLQLGVPASGQAREPIPPLRRLAQPPFLLP